MTDETRPPPWVTAPPPKEVAYAVWRVDMSGFPFAAQFSTDFAGVPADPERVGFHIVGACPRCGHQTSGLAATKWLELTVEENKPAKSARAVGRQSARRVAAQAPAPATAPASGPQRGEVDSSTSANDEHGELRTIPVIQRCACVHSHSGAPTSAPFGCGAEWILNATYPLAGVGRDVLLGEVTEDEAVRQWPALDAVYAAIPATLTTQLASAANWQKALAAIVAVLSVSTVFGGATRVQSLPGWGEVIFGIALAGTLLSTGLMLWLSDVASLGTLTSKDSPTTGDQSEDGVRNADLQPIFQAIASQQKLQTSKRLMLLAVATAAVTLGLYLFLPSPTPPSLGTYKLTEYVGTAIPTANTPTITTACGKLSPVPSGAGALSTLTLTVDHTRQPPVPGVLIKAITAC